MCENAIGSSPRCQAGSFVRSGVPSIAWLSAFVCLLLCRGLHQRCLTVQPAVFLLAWQRRRTARLTSRLSACKPSCLFASRSHRRRALAQPHMLNLYRAHEQWAPSGESFRSIIIFRVQLACPVTDESMRQTQLRMSIKRRYSHTRMRMHSVPRAGSCANKLTQNYLSMTLRLGFCGLLS